LGNFLFAAALMSAAAGLLVATSEPVWSDDTQLFKVETGKPYVFIVLDTSTSMNLAPGTNAWVPASGDDQASKFRQIKEALLEVFGEVSAVNGDVVYYGFATYNQDELKVRGKHWLYTVESVSGANVLGYPAVGRTLTLGKHFSLGGTTTDGTAGSCTAPLPIDGSASDLTKIDRFAKLQPKDSNNDGYADGYEDTTMWLQKTKGSDQGVYRLDISHVSGSGNFGPGTIQAKFTLRKKNASDICPNVSNPVETLVTMRYVTEFIMSDETAASSAQVLHCANPKDTEATAGVGWTWQDASATNTCGVGSSPFSGKGWEGNYDSRPVPASITSPPANADPACPTCTDSFKFETAFDASARVLDRGDMLPLHWDLTNRNDFFSRLAPNWAPGKPAADLEFRAAAYFRDVPNASGYLELRNPGQRPIIPYGASPLNKSVVDFRCFYIGQQDNKCKVADQPYGDGWDDLAAQQDYDEWGCRRPYLIIIGDGESHGDTNDATASVANLKKQQLKTWAIDFGGSCKPNGTYHSLTNAGDGECVTPQTKDELVDVLRKIAGVILEEVKAFASAAVPTVQADVADKVFLSNFTPLNDSPVWPGRMNAFLKPIPLTSDGKPDTSAAAKCPTTGESSGCFVWDAGAEMQSQVQADLNNQFGLAANQRRVYYSRLSESGEWATRRQYFKPRVYGTDPAAVRKDLLRGMGLAVQELEDDVNDNKASQDTANEVVREALALKHFDVNGTATTADDLPYILGDIFHSNPVVVGGPANTLYYANDVDGYRDFADLHRRRRKILLAGANDGMVHAFDAGTFNKGANKFTNGTGKELFAFIPRSVLPSIKDSFAGTGQARSWMVDGSLAVADVRVDPEFNGTPDPDEREWRTLAVGGLREGGIGYFALDITQPDQVDSDDIPVVGAGGYVPTCAGSNEGGGQPSDCGPVPFPAQLWEFTDGLHVSLLNRVLPLDEDGTGGADLAPSWSTPNLGRIRLVEGGQEVDKFVAVFGGGLNKLHTSGNWLYMVDLETGQTLYKKRVQGSIPAEPAAVDTNQDGYIDRIYAATTLGYIYRADLRTATGGLPELEEVTVSASFSGFPFSEKVMRIVDAEFAPRVIFKAQPSPTTASTFPRPIYYRPSVIYIASLNQYALAFGVGDRENLWSSDGQNGRFYTFRDSVAVGDITTFYTEEDLQPISVTGAAETVDYVTNVAAAKRGWYLDLGANEKLITNPFALSGIVLFTAFKPDVVVTGGKEPTCSRTGKSRIFAVSATNGNGLLVDEDGFGTRYTEIADFVTDPYTEQGATKNPALNDPTRRHSDQIPPGSHLADVLEQLKKLFPPNCKFGHYRIDVKTLSSDTGVVFIAPVPVCIIEKNWKEF
jgi:hypothetical protein